jgi:hypothetical protein
MMLLLDPSLRQRWKNGACRSGEQANKEEVPKRQCHHHRTAALHGMGDRKQTVVLSLSQSSEVSYTPIPPSLDTSTLPFVFQILCTCASKPASLDARNLPRARGHLSEAS